MEPFLGQIQPFAFNFAPRGWAQCDGQILPISTSTALFSLIGTTYGGDGRTTFGLPDLRGRAALHVGSGPGLTNRRLGEKGGLESVQLTVPQMPSHTHVATLGAVEADADSDKPNPHHLAAAPIYSASAIDTSLASDSINMADTGGNEAHENMQPYLVINWCIALVGIYPSRS